MRLKRTGGVDLFCDKRTEVQGCGMLLGRLGEEYQCIGTEEEEVSVELSCTGVRVRAATDLQFGPDHLQIQMSPYCAPVSLTLLVYIKRKKILTALFCSSSV